MILLIIFIEYVSNVIKGLWLCSLVEICFCLFWTKHIVGLLDHHEFLSHRVFSDLIGIIFESIWMVLESQFSKFLLNLFLTWIRIALQYLIVIKWSEDSSDSVIITFITFVVVIRGEYSYGDSWIWENFVNPPIKS